MDAILRGLSVYFFLLIITRLSGKRTLAEVTTFDFVLLLIISETTQQALMSDDFSVTNAFILITTLLFVSVALSLLQGAVPSLRKYLDGTPVIILTNGKPLSGRLKKARMDEYDILEAGRRLQGLERLDQIKYAILERDGGITIIPRESEK